MKDSAVVVMTGAASGIGRHLAGVFLKNGYRVLATDINMNALKKCA